MMRGAAPALLLAAASLVFVVSKVRAETAYVSDQLVLNVYTEQNQQGQRLATLHSGARVETLATSADFTQVRLPDGTTGWVKSSYLTTDEPAVGFRKKYNREYHVVCDSPELSATFEGFLKYDFETARELEKKDAPE